MPTQFKYVAATNEGGRRKGVITAQGTEQVIQLLEEMRMTPIRIDEVKDRKMFSSLGFMRRAEYEDLIMFTSSLSTMYKAGIPLLRTLTIIRVGKEDSNFNQVIDQLRMAIRGGRSLSDGMKDHPEVFTPVYIAGIAAGEESGQLEFTLDHLADMMEKEMELTRQIKSAIRYPMIVTGIIIGAIVVMMTFVIPRFVNFYDSFGAKLPLPTKIIMGMSNFTVHNWPILLAVVAVIILGFKKFISTPGGRRKYDLFVLKIPVIGDLIIKGNVARFTLMFRVLFRAGLPIVKSLEILSGTVKNTVISKEISKLEDMFRKGQSVEDIPDEIDHFPQQALHMIAIGLESGNLERMLGEIGNHYSKQVMYTARTLTAVIEPILTLVLGGFVLVLALAIFLPMWNLIQIFKG